MKNIVFNLCDVDDLKKCNDGLIELLDKIIMLCEGSLKPEDIEIKDLGRITEAKFIINELSRCITEAGNEM